VRDPAPNRASIENALPAVRARIEDGLAAYAEQLELWRAGVALDPPMKHRELAALSQVRTSTVSVALAKAAKAKGTHR
jgi:hypothetical protein